MLNLKSRISTSVIVLLGLLGTTGSAVAQNWTNQSNMKVARVEATTVDYRDNIYVFNGFSPGIKIANSVEKYNAATKKWSIISNTTTLNGSAMTHNGVVRVGADVWLVGGRVGSHPGKVSDKVWIFNLNTNKWRRGPDLPVPGAAGGAALVDNKVHWIGGLDTQARCDVKNHFVYDLGKPGAGWKNITAAAAIPSPRNHFSTAVVNGIIYVMGGQFGHDGCPGKGTEDTTLVHAFNPKTNKWTKKANLPSKNSHTEPGTFVYKNNIYTVGGENAGDKVWKYNPQSNKWTTFKTLPEKLVAPVARIIDGRLIVAGGGAPRAALAVSKVRSLLVDNNPPASTAQPEQTPDPIVAADPIVAPEPVVVQPEPEPGSNTPAGDTLISMEAEYFDVSSKTSSHQWVHATLGGSANDDAMITTPDQGQLASSIENTPMLSYMVFFNHPGKHYIWIRGLGDSNNAGVSDSIHVGLNGKVASNAFRVDQFPNQWTWSRNTPTNPVASVNVVNAGVNIVNLWMREDGLAIDKFVITNDPNFVPTGLGPDVTDGTSNFVPPVTAEPTTPILDDSVENAIVEEAPVNATTVVEDTPAVINAETVEQTVAPVTGNEQVASGAVDVESIESDDAQPVLVVVEQVKDEPFTGDKEEAEIVQDGAIKVDVALASDSVLDTAVDTASLDDNDSSSSGLFGGSTSMGALLMLLGFGFIRRAHFK